MQFRAVIASAVTLLAVGVAGCGGDDGSTSSATNPAPTTPTTSATTPASATKPSANISASLAEYTIKPTPAVGKAGTVTFHVRNAGQLLHEFVVLKTPKPAGSLLKGSEADESGNVGEIGDLPPGASKTLKVRLTTGHYALICNLPGHYAAGQHADFRVR